MLSVHSIYSCFKKKKVVYHTFCLKIDYFKITLVHLSVKLNPPEIFQQGINRDIKSIQNSKFWPSAKLNLREIFFT